MVLLSPSSVYLYCYLLIAVVFLCVTGKQIHRGGKVHKRAYIQGRTIRTERSNQDFESLGPPNRDGTAYFLSKSKTGRDEAIAACESFSSASGKKFQLLVLDNIQESQFVQGKLSDMGTDCVWMAANMINDPENSAQQHLVTIGPQGKKTVDFNGGFQKRKREYTKQQKQGVGALTVTETVFPFYEATAPNGESCNISPKCESFECSTTTFNCSTTLTNCTMQNPESCTVIQSDKCIVTSENCVVENPTCTVTSVACTVAKRQCQIKPPKCKITTPKCFIDRPPCFSHQPPCKVMNPNDNPECVAPKTAPCVNQTIPSPDCKYSTDCKTVNGVKQCSRVLDENCKLVSICVKATICQEKTIMCPSAQAFCPPEVVKCPHPKVECEPPEVACEEPKVNCTLPILKCTQPIISCQAPIIKCPSVVASCPRPKAVCVPPTVTCPPPETKCVVPKGLCSVKDRPSEFSECPSTMKCERNCQCVKLSKSSSGYKTTPTSCTDQCYPLCKSSQV